jgi:threonine-phosphate decarboxylase
MLSTCKKRRFVSHGGDIWGFSRKFNIPVEKVLEFSGPINYLGPSPKAVEAVKENANLIKFYPDPNPVEFREELAKYVGCGIKKENVILGNGSIELIYLITEILPRGHRAVIPIPSFSEYEKATLRVNGEPIFVQLPEDFSLEVDKIKRAVTAETKILCLCNPHSPSGTLYNKEELLELVRFCNKKDAIFSVDENYIEFNDESLKNTLASEVKDFDNLFVIRSVTKFYGMAGIRFGYALAAENLVERLENMRLPWSINGLACQVTMAAINDNEFIKQTKETIAKNRTELAKALSEIPELFVYPSVTNFLLVKIKNRKISSTQLKDRLSKAHILIRDCCTFMGLDDSYFRITIRSREDNRKIVEKINQILRN